jgi:hypothetical protein
MGWLEKQGQQTPTPALNPGADVRRAIRQDQTVSTVYQAGGFSVDDGAITGIAANKVNGTVASASFASSASFATSAGSASTAGFATSAGSATSATSATVAGSVSGSVSGAQITADVPATSYQNTVVAAINATGGGVNAGKVSTGTLPTGVMPNQGAAATDPGAYTLSGIYASDQANLQTLYDLVRDLRAKLVNANLVS